MSGQSSFPAFAGQGTSSSHLLALLSAEHGLCCAQPSFLPTPVLGTRAARLLQGEAGQQQRVALLLPLNAF